MNSITPEALQRAIDFAKQDPKGSYAQELQSRIQSGAYNTTLQQMGKDTSKYGAQPAPVSVAAPAASPAAPAEQPATFASVGGAIGDDFNKRADRVGQIENSKDNLASKILQVGGEGAGAVSDIAGEVIKSAVKPEVLASIGTHLAPLVESAAQSPAGQAILKWWENLNPEIQRNLSATGSIASLLSNAVGAGVAKEGVVVGTEAALGAAKDAVAPAVEAATEAATTGKRVVKDAVLGTPESKAAAQAAAQAKKTQGVSDLLKQNEETMTPTMKKDAITSGRQQVKNNKLGGTDVDYKPTAEIDRASQIMSDGKQVGDPIKAGDLPNVVYKKVTTAISQKGAQAEKFLEENPVKISNKEDYDMFNAMKEKVAKTSTEAELKAYDEQIELFQKQLQGRKGGYTTANYYKALKDYEANVASKMPRGKDALFDPTGIASAKVNAAAEIRTTIRDMIGDKHPEFKPQMYDLTSLYEAKDNALFNASNIKPQTIIEKHPKITKAAKVGAGIVGGATALDLGFKAL